MKTQLLKNGIFTLTDSAREALKSSPRYNKDLAPTPFAQHNWTAYNVAACWIGMNICIPAYQMASSAVTMGLSWWVALLLVALGNLIILIPIQLNAHVGTKYGIPFPVFARISFGVRGAQIPSIMRSMIGAGWTGILIWVGAESLQVAMTLIFPGWANVAAGKWIMFLVFWSLNIGIAYFGIEVLKKFESWSAPVLGVICGSLMAWAVVATYQSGHTFMDALTTVTVPSDFSLGKTLVAMLVANIAFYSTWALNIPDLSRYARDHQAQRKGQFWGLPTSMVFIAFIGVYVTGASNLVFGAPLWDPTEIIAAIGSPGAAIFAALGISLATLTTNVTTNILPPANGISNLAPSKISFRMAVLITGAVVIIMQPWKLVADPNGYIYNWLGTYGALTGPIASIFIYDYYFLRKRRVALAELYAERETRYWYKNGFNTKAIYAWALSVILPLLGKFIPALSGFALYGWLFSFAMGFVVYYLLVKNDKGSLVSVEEEEAMTEVIAEDSISEKGGRANG